MTRVHPGGGGLGEAVSDDSGVQPTAAQLPSGPLQGPDVCLEIAMNRNSAGVQLHQRQRTVARVYLEWHMKGKTDRELQRFNMVVAITKYRATD